MDTADRTGVGPVAGRSGEDAQANEAMTRLVQPAHRGEHVVVIGAGPAGLSAAYFLARRGLTVTVLEATDAVGGLSQTVQYKGYRFDIGGHRFFTKITPVEQFWDEILGAEFIDVPRLSRIHYNGRYFHYPLKAGDALAGLGVVNALLILLSYLKAKMYPSPVEETFEQWVVNRFGRRLYEIFFRTYTEKVWGIPCSEISAEWAAQRIQGLSLTQAILSATALNKRSGTIKTLINSFRYPRLGPGQMWEACRDRLVQLGGRVLMQHSVTGVELRGGYATAVTARTPAGNVRIPADHVISTMDLRSLLQAMPDAPDGAREAGLALRYRDFLVTALILRRKTLFPDNWIYVHTPGVRVGRVQNFKNWSAAMVPDPETSCIGMEYFCFEGDELWNMPDADLVALASREMEQLGLAGADEVVDGAVVRAPKAYPVYDGSYADHLLTVRSFLDGIPNLHCAGRNGMHKYNNQDHSIYTAMLTVENMLDAARHDVWAVNTDFEYHEEQRLGPRAADGVAEKIA